MRTKPYPAYKDSGVSWLGDVPEHWEVVPLKARLDSNDGGVWGEDFDDEGTIVLRSTEQTVGGGWKIEEPARRRLKPSECASALLVEGDLVITKSSGSSLHIGKTSLVTADVEKLRCCFSNFMQRLRPDDRAEPKYLFYVLNSEVGRAQFDYQSNSTSGLANLTRGLIGSLQLAVPGREEQCAIVEFLDRETAKIDALIEKKRRLIELLKEKRAALITRAVTRGLNPKVSLKDSGVSWLGDVPTHWKMKKLKHEFQVFGGGTPSKDNPKFWNGNIPWVSPKDMNAYFVTETEDHITAEAVKESATKRVPEGAALIVVRSGILRHTIPVAINRLQVTLNQDMKALLSRDECTARFFCYLVRGYNEVLLTLWRKHGTTVESLETEYMLGSEFPLPPKEEQEAIVHLLDERCMRIDSSVTKIELADTKLVEYRSALITAAVTGKIDLRH